MQDLVFPTIKKKTAGKPFYLKATLLGGGFFADAGKAGNLRSEVINTTLRTYIKEIQSGRIPKGSAIEFPRYGEESMMPKGVMEELKKVAADNGIDIIWTPQGDMNDYREQTSVTGKKIDIAKFEKEGCLVCLGAADVMSWHGNEPSSASVEAAFGNNTNMRLVMNWWANPKVLDQVKELSK